ncbi:reverse transcriptase domain-containing protein [Tanacetum coccineum]
MLGVPFCAISFKIHPSTYEPREVSILRIIFNLSVEELSLLTKRKKEECNGITQVLTLRKCVNLKFGWGTNMAKLIMSLQFCPAEISNFSTDILLTLISVEILKVPKSKNIAREKNFVPALVIAKEVVEIESLKSSTHHSSVNDFIVINIPEEDVEPKQIILDPDDQPMWESAKTVAPTPNSAIVQPNVDDNFVINSTHLKMICENKFDGYLRADPHDHIREFLAICNMFRYGETQSEAIKLLIFPFSLCDEAKTWFNELNEESITSWEQMRKAFINIFFPPSLFNRLLLEIGNFSQNIYEILTEAWLRLKNMLRKCHGHGLTIVVIIQIFYHVLDEPTQAILDVTAGGIFLYKSPNQAFQLLKDKVHDMCRGRKRKNTVTPPDGAWTEYPCPRACGSREGWLRWWCGMATVGVVVAVGGVVAWWWQREMEVTRMGVRWDGDGCDEGGGEVCRLLAGGGAAEVVTRWFWWGGRSGGSVMEDGDDGSGSDSWNLDGMLVGGRPEKERREWGLGFVIKMK